MANDAGRDRDYYTWRLLEVDVYSFDRVHLHFQNRRILNRHVD